ncbi:hypothetical protein KSF73_01520 [Burkholderiaceae bacterium DAT-1]|nr:hypothetical protein [Burkholderiaceae bacterium DAT-1]
MRITKLVGPAGFLLAFGLLVHLTGRLNTYPQTKPDNALNVRTPDLVQLAYSAGDRYLAANLGSLRSVFVNVTEIGPDDVRVLADIQASSTRLNAMNEDNYYLTQAILPWNGMVPETQSILQQVHEARQQDFLPGFFMGFNNFYFLKDFQAAGRSFEAAAAHTDGGTRQAMLAMASKFYEKVEDPRIALLAINTLIDSTRDQALKQHLEQRAMRIKGLIALQNASAAYQRHHGQPPARLELLAGTPELPSLPEDPFGFGYTLHADGHVTLNYPNAREIKVK